MKLSMKTALSQPITRKFLWSSVVIWLMVHLLIWGWVTEVRNLTWIKLLNNWDSGWYTAITLYGYEKFRWAFFPLYPLLVRSLHWIVGGNIPVSLLGTMLSTCLFLGFCHLLLRLPLPHPLAPQSRLGWLLFLLWPGTMIFHSHHTESLFLFLSLWAFFLASQQKWIRASVFAGLCALTRNHGVLVAMVVAGWVSFRPEASLPSWGARLRRFVFSGMISGSLFSLYPLYQYVIFGDPFLFIRAQQHWKHARSVWEYVQTLFYQSPYNRISYIGLLHYFFFLSLCLYWVHLRRIHRPMAYYLLMLLVLIPAQSETANIMRFGVILFPVLFELGDELKSSWAGWVCLGIFTFHNLLLTYNYAIHRWSY
jgi:Gpi18-like mannosyltransferase